MVKESRNTDKEKSWNKKAFKMWIWGRINLYRKFVRWNIKQIRK